MTAAPAARRRRRGLLVAWALGVAAGWNLANVGAIASTAARAYEVSLATVGLLTTALLLTHTLIQVPGGRASDRFGAASTGAAAMVVICVGTLVGVTAADPAVGLLARAVTGLGTGLAFVSGLALVRESEGSPFAQGLYGGIALAAAGLALALVPQVAGADGWRAPYWTAGAWAVLALVLLVALGVRSEGAQLPMAKDGLKVGVVKDRRLYRLAVIFSASYGLAVVLGNWVIELLERHTALRGGAVATIGALTLLLGIVSRPLGGWLLRRWPAAARPAVGGSLVAGGVGTFALLTADSALAATAGCVLIGMAAGIPFAPALTGAALLRPDAPAASVGLVSAAANFTILVGTPLVGLTFALPGEGRLGFVAIGVLWLATLAALPRAAALDPLAPRVATSEP